MHNSASSSYLLLMRCKNAKPNVISTNLRLSRIVLQENKRSPTIQPQGGFELMFNSILMHIPYTSLAYILGYCLGYIP